MIPSPLALLCAVSLWTPARADEPPADDGGAPEDVLSPYRTPFDVLVERTIGTASRPVEFDWRRTQVQVAATGDHLFELNNFDSLRAGGMLRLPTAGTLVELGVSHVWVSDTPSSELLAFTPYRQPGRPSRYELDLTVGLPVAEGVVTAAPRFLPPVQLVFNVYAGVRYVIYPSAFGGMRTREVMGALFSPALTQPEIDNLDDERLDAMQVDPGRYGVMLGFGDDLYLEQGVFLSPRLMMAVPLLAAASGSELLWWADLSLTVGVAF